jgi:hypothetical protein
MVMKRSLRLDTSLDKARSLITYHLESMKSEGRDIEFSPFITAASKVYSYQGFRYAVVITRRKQFCQNAQKWISGMSLAFCWPR